MTAGHELDAAPWRRMEATLMATSRAIRRAYDARLSEVGLNLSAASLLTYVHLNGPTTQTRLAEALGLRRAATGTVIDTLETAGLVARQPDPADRRVWRVADTEASGPVIVRIDALDRALRSELRCGISRAERDALSQTLLRLQTNLTAILTD